MNWINPHQPQTLYSAVILCYIQAFFAVLFINALGPLGLLITVALAAGGFGIANEKKWGYILGIVMAVLPILALVIWHNGFALGLISLMFQIALVCLLLHPQSREYQRIWFK